MAYIDYDFFSSIYGDSKISSDNSQSVFETASCIIDFLLGGETKFMLDVCSEFISYEIRRAVATQSDFIIRNGGADSFDLSDNDQVSLGKFSYRNYSDSSKGKSENSNSISPIARSILENCGLLNRKIYC